MSYTYLRELGVESSAECFSDIPASVLSKLNLTAERCFSPVNGMESSQDSRFGTTCEPLTEDLGVVPSMLCAADSPVRESARPINVPQDSLMRGADYGQSRGELLARLDRDSRSWKIPQGSLFEDSERSLETWPKWGIMHDGECYHAPMLVAFIYESGSGLRLPTIVKNEGKGSCKSRFIGSPDFRGGKMSEGLRTCESDPIYLSPSFAELVMMWPMGWTDLQPLEMDRFREWLSSHGKPLPEPSLFD